MGKCLTGIFWDSFWSAIYCNYIYIFGPDLVFFDFCFSACRDSLFSASLLFRFLLFLLLCCICFSVFLLLRLSTSTFFPCGHSFLLLCYLLLLCFFAFFLYWFFASLFLLRYSLLFVYFFAFALLIHILLDVLLGHLGSLLPLFSRRTLKRP